MRRVHRSGILLGQGSIPLVDVGKCLSLVLMTHGTDWEAMAVDGRNYLEWDVGRSRNPEP